MTLVPETYYHVYTHAVGQDNLFVSAENYRYFLQQYAKYIHPVAETFAYCLMPNHIHFCIKIREEAVLLAHQEALHLQRMEEKKQRNQTCEVLKTSQVSIETFISLQFKNLFISYSKAFNKQQNRQGSLFRSRFHKKAIENQSYFQNVIRYIHQNPVLHGFVKDLADWQFSSYNSFLTTSETLLQRNEVLDAFGNKNTFIHIHQERLEWEEWF
jgi:putative transposase